MNQTGYSSMTTFVDRLDGMQADAGVISWGCPIPFFGDITSATVATVGINPSNREFVDRSGRALDETERRLPTLRSLGVKSWGEVNSSHVKEILSACVRYFENNPYDSWFRVLQRILDPSGLTFYGSRPTSCHIDLVPFATEDKWGTLAISERKQLLEISGDAIGHLLRESSLKLLVLNGQSVVDNFEILTNTTLSRFEMGEWNLERNGRSPVRGVAYIGDINEVGGVLLGRSLRVVGYNHNLQSSFGVTRRVMSNIAVWLNSVHERDAA